MKKPIFILLMLWFTSIYAETALHQFSDDAKRDHYKDITTQLRCPKCQNQDLADSNAPIAADLRNQIATMVEQNKTDKEIIDFMVSRYGDFVLYKPRFSGYTLILWVTPTALLLIALIVLWQVLRHNRNTGDVLSTMDESQQRELKKLLKERDNT